MYPNVEGVMLLDQSGRVRYASPPSRANDASGYLRGYHQRSPTPFLGLRWPSTGPDPVPSAVVAEPARGSEPGVTAIVLKLSSLQGLLAPDSGIGERGRVYLVHPEHGAIGVEGAMRDSSLDVANGADVPADRSLSAFIDSRGVEMAGRLTPVGSLPWTVVAGMPASDAFADVRQMRSLMLAALLGIGALGTFLAWRFSSTITRPLKKVVAGARAIGRGRLEHRIAVSSSDEVGQLATSFNRMAADLTQARADLVRAERQTAHLETSERVLQATPMSILVVDEEQRILIANDVFYSTFGLNRQDSQGRPLADAFGLGDLRQDIARSLEQPSHYRGTWTSRDSSGTLRHFLVSVKPMGTSGAGGQILVALEDMTDRVAAEWRYRYLMENANDGVFIVNAADGEILEVNTRVVEMVGLHVKEDLIGQNLATVHPASMAEVAERHMRETLQHESTVFDDLPLNTREGATLEVQVSARLVELGDERLILSVVRDVSKQKAAERAVRESEERYRRLVERSPDAIFVHTEGRLVYANLASAGLFGVDSPEDLIGRQVLDFVWKEDREAAADRIKQMHLEAEVVPLIETRIVGRDGRIRAVEAAGGPISFQGMPAAQLVLRDITERKRVEEQLQKAGRLASVGELAAGVAHEINNPLTSILGFSQLLLSEDLSESVQADLRKIGSEAERAAKVVRNLLSFSRRYEPEQQYLDVSQVVEAALELKAHEFQFSNVRVATHLSRGSARTMLDENQLVQVILNILSKPSRLWPRPTTGVC